MDRTIRTIAILIAKLPVAAAAASSTATATAAVPSTAKASSTAADLPAHTVRMPEDRLCRLLAAGGARLGIRIVVIDPSSCSSLPSGKLAGFELNDGEWKPCRSPLPALVYDRSFASNAQERIQCRTALRALADAGVTPLSSGLPGKWAVHQALACDPRLAPILAPTWLYRREELPKLLLRHPHGLFLKPSAGTQGRGTIRITKHKQGAITIEGRTRSNRPFRFISHDENQMLKLVDRLAGSRSYLAQPFLPLTDEQGRPHDVRLLVQKNGRSRWTVTGAACRIGAAGSITSNLHGGGAADLAEARLTRLYGSGMAQALLDSIREAGLRAAAVIEQHFGKFAEFGFDFGLSPDGKLWLLEANSKPGRHSFKLIGDERTERLSYTRLLDYARKLADRRTTGPQAIKNVTSCNQYAFFPSDYVQEVHS